LRETKTPAAQAAGVLLCVRAGSGAHHLNAQPDRDVELQQSGS